MAKVESVLENTALDTSQDKAEAASLMQGQIEYLYKNKTLGIWSNILLAGVLLVFFWLHFSNKQVSLLIWFGLVVTVSLVRYLMGKSFKPKRQYTQQELTSWANRHVFFTTLLSTIWGLTGIVFFPNDLAHLGLLVFILFSVLLSAIPTLAASRIAYYFQIIVTLVPTTLLLFLSKDIGHDLFALSIIVMAGTLVLVSGYIYSLLFELQNAQIALQALADTDQLTGIANRRHFDRKFKVEWRRAMREQTPISLLLIDVDHFKKYNDTYGHQAGDRCLQQIAKALESVSHRPADLASRYGGEEFAVLLPVTSQENAAMLAERLRKKIESLKIEHSKSEFGIVTISVGVSCCKPVWDFTGNTPDEEQKVTFPAMLLTASDNALYVSKEQGRNQISEQGCGDQKMSKVLQKQKEENIPIA
ncbi:GGDEF domain-containing protein [uncultured Cocleimonas sp.]|uniref:GGDEF domain-containing protein n=1 Tax=uncultured Cocleimonas sp. TaxID=1051587 RepID=UPI002621CF07|nr:GGDEF domain-containing protein [uncultured Cocleimonas sp.]